MNIASQQYGAHDITVTISLTLARRYTSYNISVIPPVSPVPITSTLDGVTQIIQLTLLYNVKYNLSVEVSVLCRGNMITPFNLYYGEMHICFDIHNKFGLITVCTVDCGYPLTSTDSMLQVTGYRGPPVLEGTTVNFHCSSGLILVGNTSATCKAEGQWEPDPNELTCSESKLHKLPTKLEFHYDINEILRFPCS